MRKVSDKKRTEIVGDVAKKFHCFGRGAKAIKYNPIVEWVKDKPPIFALGVDVREVVDYIISRL